MKRVAKPEGKYNVILEEVPMPEPGPEEVRVKAVRTLISRGSEIRGRYVREEAIDPQSMGYSLAGIVDAVGERVDHLEVGDRVGAVAPHAQYVVCPVQVSRPARLPYVLRLTDELTWDQAPYWMLGGGAVRWVDIEEIQPNDVVAIVGQGLVGSLVMQVAKANGNGRIIAIDALDLRCSLAGELGADVVINAAKEDPVEAVRKLTNGLGADIVVYAVGGPAGPKAFGQSVDMLAPGGLLHLVGLNEEQALPLYSSKIQGRRLLGGYYGGVWTAGSASRAMELLVSGAIQADRMTTHHFPYVKSPDAFHLLHNRIGETMGVLLDWDVEGG